MNANELGKAVGGVLDQQDAPELAMGELTLNRIGNLRLHLRKRPEAIPVETVLCHGSGDLMMVRSKSNLRAEASV